MHEVYSIIYRRLVMVHSQLILSERYFWVGRSLHIGRDYMRIWSQRAREQEDMQPRSGWIPAVVEL